MTKKDRIFNNWVTRGTQTKNPQYTNKEQICCFSERASIQNAMFPKCIYWENDYNIW